MSKIDTTVGQLVDMVGRGELRLPEMQRRYVWTSTRVRDLLDSLYRGYPSGTILVWETDLEQPTRDLAVPQAVTPFTSHKLLLDGQQRITSLSAVLRGESVNVRNRKRPIEIAFNLDHPEGPQIDLDEVVDDQVNFITGDSNEEDDDVSGDNSDNTSVLDSINRRVFTVASRQILKRPNWISVTDVFSNKKGDWAIIKGLVDSPDDPKYELYSKRLQRLRSLRDYPYVMQVLGRDRSYEEVAEIFVRVNSLGAKLRGSDLAMAQVTAKWQNSLALFESFIDECEENWFTLDTGLLVRLIVIFATKQCRFNTVTSISLERLKESWEMAKEGLRFTINFLRTNADIEDESLLSSPFFMIPIAVHGILKNQEISQEDEKEMLRWLYVANARGHYSVSSESTLDSDLGLLFKGKSFKELLDPVKQRSGRLSVEPNDFKGRGNRSALFSLTYLALKHSGAKDWKTGLGLSLTHQGMLHYIEYHHIFPKSLLKKAGYEKSEINEIANMAFISGRANKKISNKYPIDYFPVVLNDRGDSALTSQYISLDKQLWDINNYRSFLENRREALAEAVNKYINAAYKNGRAIDIN